MDEVYRVSMWLLLSVICNAALSSSTHVKEDGWNRIFFQTNEGSVDSSDCPSVDICNRFHRKTLLCKLQSNTRDACGACKPGYANTDGTYACTQTDAYDNTDFDANIDVEKSVDHEKSHHEKHYNPNGIHIGATPYTIMGVCVGATTLALLLWLLALRRRVNAILDDDSDEPIITEGEDGSGDVDAGFPDDKVDGDLEQYEKRKAEINGYDLTHPLSDVKVSREQGKFSIELGVPPTVAEEDVLDEYSGPAAPSASEVNNPLFEPSS